MSLDSGSYPFRRAVVFIGPLFWGFHVSFRECSLRSPCRPPIGGLGCKIQGLGFRVQGVGFRVMGFGDYVGVYRDAWGFGFSFFGGFLVACWGI